MRGGHMRGKQIALTVAIALAVTVAYQQYQAKRS